MNGNRTDTINIHEAAVILGVSSATVRNWIKHDYIKPVGKARYSLFKTSDVKNLKYKIDSGLIERLTRRANKATANRKFIPDEYIEDIKDREILKFIVESINEMNIDASTALLLLSINLLVKSKQINSSSLSCILSFKKKYFNNISVMNELKCWFDALKDFQPYNRYETLIYMEVPVQQDILGLIYQSLKAEGDKSFNGSYYTPREIVENIISDCRDRSGLILDPCCGTGQFLISFAESFNDPERVFGFDIDEIAVRIARLNLIINFRDHEFVPNIFHFNTLTGKDCHSNISTFSKKIKSFDIIATNPPWGIHFNESLRNRLTEIYPGIQSFESFSYFLQSGIDMLEQGGRMSFILPESILNVKSHRDIREYILKNTSIKNIIYLDRVFKNVFSPVIRLDITKTKDAENKLTVKKSNSKYLIHQKEFLNNPYFIFSIHASRKDSRIIDRIYRVPHITLKDNAEWILGIVTGNNGKYLSKEKGKGYEEIITGKDIEKFRIADPHKYIRVMPDKFQQMAPVSRYRAKEKLVYRFISKNLVFSYDDRQRVTLNSANSVIPRLDDYPMKVIMALFNSSVYQFIFQKKFSSIKVLRSHIESLPLPLWDKKSFKKITGMVDSILSGDSRYDELDRFIIDGFSLKRKDIINNC